MPKRTRSYRSWQQEKLTNPRIAADYLNASLDESREGFLASVKAVVQAHQVARVAREAGVQRETLYRSLSSEGNPTFDTLFSVLKAVGIQIKFGPASKPKEVKGPPIGTQVAATVAYSPAFHVSTGIGTLAALNLAQVGSHNLTWGVTSIIVGSTSSMAVPATFPATSGYLISSMAQVSGMMTSLVSQSNSSAFEARTVLPEFGYMQHFELLAGTASTAVVRDPDTASFITLELVKAS